MEQEKKNQNGAQELSVGDQIKVRREKLANLQAEGHNPFEITKFVQTTNSREIRENFDAMEGKPVSIAGRMMSKRGMGKVSFCDLQDKEGRIQLYARKDEMDEDDYNRFKKYDIGDIIGIEGEVFRTQRGEMSVRAKHITLLSKSLLPLPEKFHGLTDKETRYRQRYVDLIVNPEVKRNFVIRSQFIKHLRDYLDNMGYIEVETPVLNTIAGGAAARPFITHHNTLDIDMYMRIATELPLKRLIVGGMDRVYEVGRIFRNEGMDPKHNPEFTTVELYQAYADFHDMMDIAEGVYTTFAKEVMGSYQLEWMGEDDSDGTGVFNGDMGVVLTVDTEEKTLVVFFDDGRTAEYEYAMLEELELAYCLSVHKSQGSEFACVVMPCVGGPPMLLTRNLFYTALTRAKELVVLVGREDAISAMVNNNHIARRYTALCQRLGEIPAGE